MNLTHFGLIREWGPSIVSCCYVCCRRRTKGCLYSHSRKIRCATNASQPPNSANYYKSRILCIWKGKSRKGRPLRAYHISFSPFSSLFWTPLSSYLIEKCSPLSLPSCLCLPVLFYSFSGIPIWLFVILSHFLSLVFLVCYNGIPSYFMCTDSYFLCCASTNSVCTHLCLFILYL